MLHMVTIKGLAESTLGWRALPPVPLRSLDYPAGSRVTMPGDMLEVRHPDGSVLTGTVGMWGVDAWQDELGTIKFVSGPDGPEVSVTIAGIAEADLVPGAEVWVKVYPLTTES